MKFDQTLSIFPIVLSSLQKLD